jgi:hypothetical protein
MKIKKNAFFTSILDSFGKTNAVVRNSTENPKNQPTLVHSVFCSAVKRYLFIGNILSKI